MMQIQDGFYELFDGNRLAIGTEDGGCVRLSDARYDWVNHVYMHLTDGDEHAVGVYPLVCRNQENWWVKWGCVDFDEGEEVSFAHAQRVLALLKKFDITAWVERSRSKGSHVWVFCSEWVPAWVMRRSLLVVTSAVGAPIKEINPKSEGFDNPKTLGNYVRLPYPGWLDPLNVVSPTRRVVLDKGGIEMMLEEFVHAAMASRCRPEQLERLASIWVPPKPIVHREVTDIPTDEGLEDAISRCLPTSIGILMDGPHEGRDRSSTLYWLGSILVRDRQHTYDECIALVRYADERWGHKYEGRADAERRYQDIIDKAWDNR